MKKGFKSGLVVLIVLVVVVIGVSIGSIFLPTKDISSNFSFSNDSQIFEYNKGNSSAYKNEYIAAVYLEGTIEASNSNYNQVWILNTIKKLKNDPKNVGMALFINSPGGAVYQADEVYLALQQYKSKGKKIYVYQGPLAASGGYYISCAGDQIWANRNTLTGSIGVIAGQSFDMTDFLDNLGIKSETIHAGKNKNMGNYNEPLTNEQRDILQSVADECYEQFVGIVVSQRHLDFNTVYALADGRIYTAFQALNNGLIDQIDSWENMVNCLADDLEKPGIKVVTYKKEKDKHFYDYLTSTVTNLTDKYISAKSGIPSKILNDIDGFNSYPAFLYR